MYAYQTNDRTPANVQGGRLNEGIMIVRTLGRPDFDFYARVKQAVEVIKLYFQVYNSKSVISIVFT